MSQHLLSLRYAFQNPVVQSDPKTQTVLLSIEGSHDKTHQSTLDQDQVWCIAGAGERSHDFWKRCGEGWELAQIDNIEREVVFQGQQQSERTWQEQDPNWQDSLLAQITAFQMDTEKQKSNTKYHLVLILGQSLPSQLTPLQPKNIRFFSSITVLFETPPNQSLIWTRWATFVGAKLIFNQNRLSSYFAESIQTYSSSHSRFPFALSPHESIRIQSITQLTPSLHSLSIDAKKPKVSLVTPGIPEGQRASWLLHLSGDFKNIQAPIPLLTCAFQNQKYTIQYDLDFTSQLEILNPGVAFTNQLSHRAHCIEGILYSYQQNHLRRVLQYLDQWLKLSIAFENEESSRWLYDLKIRFLSLGTFREVDFQHLVGYGFTPIYQLLSSGQWKYPPYSFDGLS